MRLRFTLSVLPLAASAGAQVAPPRDTVQALEKVTVSATRSGAAAFVVPLAVTSIGDDELHRGTGIGLDQALRFVPGVLAHSRSGGTDVRLVIRGYGARGAGDRSNSGTSRGIRILLDGFPETEPDGRTAFDAIDLGLADRLDVVRSNASALWGNASGGMVSVSTVPRFAESRLNLEPMAGTFGLSRIAASAGTKVGTSGRAWLSHSNTTQEGWRANSSGRRQLFTGGASAALSDKTLLTVMANATSNLIHVPGPLTQAEYDANPQQANATYLSRRERRHNRVGRLGVSIEHDATDDVGLNVAMFVNPKFLQRSERNTYRDFTRSHFGTTVSGHVRHSLAGRIATFRAGGDAAYQNGAIQFHDLVAGERGTTLTDNKAEGARNIGFFVQDEIPLTNKLVATLGLRHDDIQYDYRSFIRPQMNARKSFDQVTPKLGLSYSMGRRHMFYLNIGGGVEVPAGNETDPSNLAPLRLDTITALNPLLEPIRSYTFEVGTRRSGTLSSSLAGSYDIALYNTEVTNEIVPYSGGRFYFMAGKARRQGAELGLSVQSSLGVGVQAAVTYNRHRYVSYIVDSTYYGRPGFSADYSGNSVVGVPDLMSSGEVFFHPARFGWLRMEIGARHSVSYAVDDANTVTAPSSLVLDGGIAVTRTLGRHAVVTARLAVENVTNRAFAGSAFVNPDRQAVTNAPMFLEPGMPRTILLAVSATRAK
ncbi:MAG: TonB-dependent receptor [Gemmatimonadota bacterium]